MPTSIRLIKPTKTQHHIKLLKNLTVSIQDRHKITIMVFTRALHTRTCSRLPAPLRCFNMIPAPNTNALTYLLTYLQGQRSWSNVIKI